MLEHGGRLRAAALRYDIPLADWLDLSTGINPQPWPVPTLPPEVWQRLPEDEDGLETAAAAYYGNDRLLAVAGSQAAIQGLPTLLPRAAAACLSPLYAEHPAAWQKAGFKVRQLGGALPRALGAMTPYVLMCNPNNPTGARYSRERVLDAAEQLKKRGGWLIVDEAFVDATPEDAVADLAGSDTAPNLLVLRSLGKFFGLAGLRLGFLFGAADLRERLGEQLGPWAVSHPARAVGRLALADTAWQTATRQRLAADSARLAALLAPLGNVTATPLFVTVDHENAAKMHETLATRGILTRLFAESNLLRFGLPADETGWQRLADALHTL